MENTDKKLSQYINTTILQAFKWIKKNIQRSEVIFLMLDSW